MNKVSFDWHLGKSLRLGIQNPSIRLGSPVFDWAFSTLRPGLTHQSSIGYLTRFDQALISKLRLSAGPLRSSQVHNASTSTSEGPSTGISYFTSIRTSERNDLRMAFQCRVSLNLRCSDEGSSEHFESELRLITRPRAGRSCLIGNVLNRFELDFEAGKEGRFEGMK